MTWILLRGLTREARHWGQFADMFAARLAAAGLCRQAIIAIDLPGSGKFAHLKSPSDVRQMVAFVRDRLADRNIRPPYYVLAMSLGGMVATDWSQTWPEEVANLVLINTSMRPYGSIAQRLRPQNWANLARLAAVWHRPEEAESIIYRLTCNRPIESPGDGLSGGSDAANQSEGRHVYQPSTQADDLAAWVSMRRQCPVRLANAARQLYAAARFRCAPAPPLCPTLVLSSSTDRLVDDNCSVQLAHAWPAAVHERHGWAGHDLPHDDPDWVCERILKWF